MTSTALLVFEVEWRLATGEELDDFLDHERSGPGASAGPLTNHPATAAPTAKRETTSDNGT